MVWEFQQLEIHFPRPNLQQGFSRVFNRPWATVFVPKIGNRQLDAGLRSSCATHVRKQLVESKGSRGAAHERAPL